MKQETEQSCSGGALKRRGSARLGVITARKPDTAYGRQTHLIGLDKMLHTSTTADMQKPAHNKYKGEYVIAEKYCEASIPLTA